MPAKGAGAKPAISTTRIPRRAIIVIIDWVQIKGLYPFRQRCLLLILLLRIIQLALPLFIVLDKGCCCYGLTEAQSRQVYSQSLGKCFLSQEALA